VYFGDPGLELLLKLKVCRNKYLRDIYLKEFLDYVIDRGSSTDWKKGFRKIAG